MFKNQKLFHLKFLDFYFHICFQQKHYRVSFDYLLLAMNLKTLNLAKALNKVKYSE
jgi:hypothetical protein